MAKKATKNVEAKASDKALATTDSKAMTNAEMIERLNSIGVTPAKKAKKEDLEKLLAENAEVLALMDRLADNKEACLVKSFGAHGSSGLCPKCKKKQVAVYNDCAAFMNLKGVKKAASKKTRKMGHRTGTELWGTRKKTYANDFCKAVLGAGEAGLSMTEARKAKWNPKGYSFNETADRLVSEGIAVKKDGRIFVTELGIEQSGRKAA